METNLESVQKKAVKDFTRMGSCAYSIALNLGKDAEGEDYENLLNSVVGLGGGVVAMGNTCGAINAGVAVLGSKYGDGKITDEQFYSLCQAFYDHFSSELFNPNCGQIHGFSNLMDNYRKAMFRTSVKKCFAVIKTVPEVLKELDERLKSGVPLVEDQQQESIRKMDCHFKNNCFHCTKSVLDRVEENTKIDTQPLIKITKGFVGGIGFNGTLCGAVLAGIMVLGHYQKVRLSETTVMDSMKMALFGLIKGSKVIDDERIHRPAKVYSKGRTIYLNVQKEFGGVNCHEILKLNLAKAETADAYISQNKITTCKQIADYVAEEVIRLRFE